MAPQTILNTSSSHFYIIGLGLAVVVCLYTYRIFRGPLSSVPGPWISQYTDLYTKYKWLTGQRAFYIQSLHEKYGSVVRVGPAELDVTDLAAVREIHSIKHGYLKTEWYPKLVVGGFINVFSTTDRELHRRYRRLLSSPFSESSLKTVEPFVRERADLAMARIGEEMKSRGAADVFKWSLFFSTDVIGELSFGQSFRMLDIGKPNQYVQDLQSVAKFSGIRATFPRLVKLSNYIPLPMFNQVAASGQRIASYATDSIARYKRLIAADPTDPRPMLFTKLFKAGEDGLTDREIAAHATAYIVAGSDTTALSLTYLIWNVCRDESIKQRLVKELADLPDEWDDQHLKQLRYLNQVIDETLRLHSAAPAGLPRVVPTGGVEMGGFYIPGGTTVCTQAYSLHRDPEVWPRPEEFDPGRWEGAVTREMKDSFMPFGGGSRICIGLHLARMELRLATALFFREWPNAKMSALEGMTDRDMEKLIYFLVAPKGKRCLIQAS